MSQEDRLVGLHDIRLPSDVPFQVLADLAAGIGLGLIIAAALWPLVHWVTRPGKKQTSKIEEEITRLKDQPEDIRVPGLLILLEKQLPGAVKERFGSRLYQPGNLPNADVLEQAIRDAV